MTTPITGPYYKTDYLWDIPHWNGTSNVNYAYWHKRGWNRQAKPYNLPLAFDSVTKRGKSRYTSNGPYGSYYGSSGDATAMVPERPDIRADVYNRAYARFVDEMGAAVELGVATAEGSQALSMITRRLGQMSSFVSHLKKGQLGYAAGDLGLEWGARAMPERFRKAQHTARFNRQSDRTRESARGFSSLFLEFHFGWSPLMKDIHDAMEVLDKPLEPHRIKVSSTGSYPDPLNYKKISSDADYLYDEGRDGTYVQTIKLQGDLIITNANVAMMQQCGILNPASIAWEMVPFSFVLDWFVNVGDYLGSLTDFAGVSFQNAHNTVFTRYTGKKWKIDTPKFPSYSNSGRDEMECTSAHCYRRLGLGTGPVLKFRAPKPWPVARGLAAASLLMQRFPRQVIDENALTLAKKRTAFRGNVFPQFYGKYF